jgi:hypothetical protein
MTTTTVRKDAAKTAVNDEREPVKLQKRIGSTMFTINVFTSPTATETAEQKTLRLIEWEVQKNENCC